MNTQNTHITGKYGLQFYGRKDEQLAQLGGIDQQKYDALLAESDELQRKLEAAQADHLEAVKNYLESNQRNVGLLAAAKATVERFVEYVNSDDADLPDISELETAIANSETALHEATQSTGKGKQ